MAMAPDPRMPERSMPDLARVRRLEALGFRAWPAASVRYDGSWQIRLTAGHPARRLNSVNPLDPSDDHDIARRVAGIVARFRSFGRRPIFRLTPLSPGHVAAWLDEAGWDRAGESLVMSASISALDLEDAIDQLPTRDIGRYVDAALATGDRAATIRPGLSEILSSIRPSTGLFVREAFDGEAASTVICVHDGDHAGILDLASAERVRRQGHGRAVLLSALKWARFHGARHVWLQVEADNPAARRLYADLGFDEVYRYHYRLAPEDAGS